MPFVVADEARQKPAFLITPILHCAHAHVAYLSPEITNQQDWADSQQGDTKHYVMVVRSKQRS